MIAERQGILVFITGCNGFTGKSLIDYINREYPESLICGMDLQKNGSHGLSHYFEYREGLKRAGAGLMPMLKSSKKIYCFHLAADIFNKDFKSMIYNNLSVTKDIFDFLKPFKDKTRILNVGSSAEYGYAGRKPITENVRPMAVSNYGLSKVFQNEMASFFCKNYGMDIISTRTFNLTGPGQSEKFFCGRIVRSFIDYKRGKINSIEVDNLSTYRDMIDVRDVVRAYTMLLMKGKSGHTYNVASGKAVSLKRIVKIVSDVLSVNPRLKCESAVIAKNNVPYQRADIDKITKDTGWHPGITFKNTLRDMIDIQFAEGQI